MREENRSTGKKLFEDRREPNKEAHTINTSYAGSTTAGSIQR
jgi:hypothetical protein